MEDTGSMSTKDAMAELSIRKTTSTESFTFEVIVLPISHLTVYGIHDDYLMTTIKQKTYDYKNKHMLQISINYLIIYNKVTIYLYFFSTF